MIIVFVYVHVLPECIEAFKNASLKNATESVRENGIARFDVIQETEDFTRFVLIEVYRTQQAVIAHKETAHYSQWRDEVVTMMAEPRKGIKYSTVYPEDKDW